MGKVIDLKTIARPIRLDNRQEKLDKRRKEIIDKQEKLKKQTRELLKKGTEI